MGARVALGLGYSRAHGAVPVVVTQDGGPRHGNHPPSHPGSSLKPSKSDSALSKGRTAKGADSRRKSSSRRENAATGC